MLGGDYMGGVWPVKRPCLTCGRPTTATYCPEHAPRRHDGKTTTERGLGHDYRKVAERVLAEETLCWMDGLPARDDDPLTVDHLVPRSQGGTHERGNLRAAHRSCNSRRGARAFDGVGVVHDEHGRFAV